MVIKQGGGRGFNSHCQQVKKGGAVFQSGGRHTDALVVRPPVSSLPAAGFRHPPIHSNLLAVV
ncbi:MAG: hypothetical protein LBK25_09265 [Treponema sp.]|jgi:hypothetical protein|nr:hypothetical protein [Treponema sp.]